MSSPSSAGCGRCASGPTGCAKSASLRRDNVRISADGLKAKLEPAQRERDEAMERVSRAEMSETRVELRSRRHYWGLALRQRT